MQQRSYSQPEIMKVTLAVMHVMYAYSQIH